MTSDEFNEKYKDFLEEGHYGLAINDKEFIEWLDERFQTFIQKTGFSYSQIKMKFGFGRFYCEGLEYQEIKEVESKIKDLK
jgi:hypothetical protein